MDEISAKVQFNSKKESLNEVADELNDIKMILLSVALKLGKVRISGEILLG
ncbi:hypothetical protein OIPHN330_23370 [Citrobacter freundii]|uniref:hypothetical protein n=1 Tax=Citrobacter freundii TaxID=546 RepID=UPI002B2A3432|nr:hypothetical protein OIPHN330_23370 [Citrobacter freundii]